ncbi:MAG: hypothetical protein LBR44_00875, partial [Clostridiales Family XIII bacterium]|nr:hypothetical protein [Clostridiales Family XIII bacterium]
KADLEKIRDGVRAEIEAKGANKFVIVAFHKAPYGGYHQKESDVKTIVQYWVPMFEEMGVDLVLNGHDHNYIRSYPLKGGVPSAHGDASQPINTDEAGVVYQVTGHSGEKYYAMPARRGDMEVLWTPQPSISSGDAAAYSVITVGKNEILVKSYSVGGILLDSYALTDDTSMLLAA